MPKTTVLLFQRYLVRYNPRVVNGKNDISLQYLCQGWKVRVTMGFQKNIDRRWTLMTQQATKIECFRGEEAGNVDALLHQDRES